MKNSKWDNTLLVISKMPATIIELLLLPALLWFKTENIFLILEFVLISLGINGGKAIAMKKIESAKKEISTDTTNEMMKDLDKSFYTKSMDLSDKDFFSDDEETEKKIPIGIKILLILVLIALIGVSIYFIYQSF